MQARCIAGFTWKWGCLQNLFYCSHTSGLCTSAVNRTRTFPPHSISLLPGKQTAICKVTFGHKRSQASLNSTTNRGRNFLQHLRVFFGRIGAIKGKGKGNVYLQRQTVLQIVSLEVSDNKKTPSFYIFNPRPRILKHKNMNLGAIQRITSVERTFAASQPGELAIRTGLVGGQNDIKHSTQTSRQPPRNLRLWKHARSGARFSSSVIARIQRTRGGRYVNIANSMKGGGGFQRCQR